MCDVKELFYSLDGKDPIEGYLGDSNECEILFVLKEPNDPDPDGFWFKKEVVDEVIKEPNVKLEKAEEKYLHVLGYLAYRLRGGPSKNPNNLELANALKHCAFINIYPCSGERNTSSKENKYKKTLRRMKKIRKNKTYSEKPCYITDVKDYFNIAQNRLQIINSMNWKLLVTVCGAFEVIANKNAEECYVGIVAKKPEKQFRITYFENDMNRYVLSYYHPSHACAWNVENDLSSLPECLTHNCKIK